MQQGGPPSPSPRAAGTPPKQKPRPARRSSSQDLEDQTARNDSTARAIQREGSTAASHSELLELSSPRDFLSRRGGFHEAVAAQPTSPSISGSPASWGTLPNPTTRPPPVLTTPDDEGAPAAQGASPVISPMPSISPLRLDRLSAGREKKEERWVADATAEDTEGAIGGRSARRHASWSADVLATAGVGGSDGTGADSANRSELTMALGSAPLSGIRSARYTPGRHTPGRVPKPVEAGARPPLASVPSCESTHGDEDELSASCGGLSVFVVRGPAVPQGRDVLRGPLPRSFYEACRPLTTADGTPVSWPPGAAQPHHLRFFCFPDSLIDRLCADASDAYGFTFSFTAEDGSFRWGCAVTGVDPSDREALNVTSVVVLCDWPLVRMLLDLAKQLFLLEQRQRKGWRGLHPNVSAFARALEESKHEASQPPAPAFSASVSVSATL